jgi:predicted ATP-dependent protease
MADLTKDEQFIINAIKNKGEGGKITYKKLQEICAEEFEGVRLILKKLKEKGLVDYEGMIPSFNAEITLK